MCMKTKLTNKLENEYHFRDYHILPDSRWTQVNSIGVHRLINSDDDLDSVIEDSIDTFSRDGYPMIYFYIESQDSNVIQLFKNRSL